MSADALCGVLDVLSFESPIETWRQVEEAIDLDDVLEDNRHTSRLFTLYQLALRAHEAGASSAELASHRIASLFRPGVIQLAFVEDVRLPKWADCIASHWRQLEELNIVTRELANDLTEEITAACTPFDVQDVCDLEDAVSDSFGAPKDWPLNRWEARVHFALNRALFPYASLEKLESITRVLRVFNPSAPCRSRSSDFEPPDVLACLSATGPPNHSVLIGDSSNYYLHYREFSEDAHNVPHDIEILAVTIPSATRRRSFFLPEIEAVFRSTERPISERETLPHETCYHVQPEVTLFGAFTAAHPTPRFADLASCDSQEFTRTNWRIGRSCEFQYFGRPLREGCLLSVRKSAISLPDDQKLAWIVTVDGEVQTMIDEDNNELY